MTRRLRRSADRADEGESASCATVRREPGRRRDRNAVFAPAILLLALAAIVGAGCRGPSSGREPVDEALVDRGDSRGEADFARPIDVELRDVGASVEGRPIEIRVLGDGAETVFILATIHGDESAGTPLLAEMEQYLIRRPELLDGRRLVLLPVANPDGYVAGRRTNVRGVDLNRNFPADNFRSTRRHGGAAASEPEAEAILRILDEYPPDRVASIHQPVACVDWDGPADAIARAAAAASPLRARKIGAREGSLGSLIGVTLGIPILTIELRGGDEHVSSEALWQRYGAMMIAFLVYPEPVGGIAVP